MDNKTANERGPFRLISSREVYSNNWLRVREDAVIRPDGKDGIFGVVNIMSGATVAAVDDKGRVLLAREYKYALGKVSLELISGGADSGESPFDTARRELKEEAGLLADEWNNIGYVDPLTTVLLAPSYLFVARGLHCVERELDTGEEVELVWMALMDAVRAVERGEITHAASCIAILKLARMAELGSEVRRS